MRITTAITIVLTLAAAAQAELVTKTIAYTHGDVELEGVLVYDDAIQTPRPGVMVVHEWWGRNDYAVHRATMLAEMGYVAFAADMYGKGMLTNDPSQAQAWSGKLYGDVDTFRARAQAGLDVLRAQPQTDGKRIAAIGYCFGGTAVLQLAGGGAQLNGVVSFHGGLPDSVKPDTPIHAKVLICHGADDDFIKPQQITRYTAALNAAEVDWQMISYSGAVHSFTSPAADSHGIPGVKYHADADRRSWQHMQTFFEEIFE